MKILVTGATGFVGGRVVEALSRLPHLSITATGRSSLNPFHLDPEITFLVLDLSEPLATMPQYDACVHCAGLADDASSTQELYRANVQATQNLCSALTQCKVFIFISSASVYDFSDEKVKVETDTHHTDQLSEYGKSKLQAEHSVANATLPSRYILRPRAVYGRGDRHLLPRICRLIRTNRLILPFPLEKKASLTHIDNLIESILAALKQAKAGLHIYNISDPKAYQLHEVFWSVAQWHTQGQLKSILVLPNWALKTLLFLSTYISKWFDKPPLLTPQSLRYLALDAVLDCSAIQKDLKIEQKQTFSKVTLYQ
jgi:2-alkyl-3-oxoalkanoate reductase